MWWDWPDVSVSCDHLRSKCQVFVQVCGRVCYEFQYPDSVVQQPIKIHTMGSGDMSHGRAPVFYGHSGHSIVFVENKNRRSFTGDVWVWKTKSRLFFDLLSVMRDFVFPAGDWRKSSITSHKSSAGIISNLRSGSAEMTSASVLLCENTCDHIQGVETLYTCLIFVYVLPHRETGWRCPRGISPSQVCVW